MKQLNSDAFDAIAPDDARCDAEWKSMMKRAEAFGFIVQAYSGVATLALPREQRKVERMREQTLRAARLGASADDLKDGSAA